LSRKPIHPIDESGQTERRSATLVPLPSLLPTPSRKVVSGMHVLPPPPVGARCAVGGASRFSAGVHRPGR